MRPALVVFGQDHVQAAALGDPWSSRMSVPRPAMLVATVIRSALPGRGDDLRLLLCPVSRSAAHAPMPRPVEDRD